MAPSVMNAPPIFTAVSSPAMCCLTWSAPWSRFAARNAPAAIVSQSRPARNDRCIEDPPIAALIRHRIYTVAYLLRAVEVRRRPVLEGRRRLRGGAGGDR